MAAKKTTPTKTYMKQAESAPAKVTSTYAGSFEQYVEDRMHGDVRHQGGMRREDAEREAAALGLKHRGR